MKNTKKSNSLHHIHKLVVILITQFIVISLISSCANNKVRKHPVITDVKIIDILSNPKLYANKTIVLEAFFAGWAGNCSNNLIIRTRSDWIIYDDTGCIAIDRSKQVEILYHERPLNPWNKSNYGGKIRVKGVVSLINGKPILG